ncbi:MAG TPA: response regulator [Fibrobacteria bacterium]|nr:response regulator [Fibrobacteria bacterium]
MLEPTVWKALVVEDDAGISASLLRGRPDFEVAAAHRLEEAERLFRERPGSPFHVLLLDLSLADIADPHGLDAYRRLRSAAPGVPIVVLAGSGADEAAVLLAAEGAAGCLPRQSTPAEALAWTLRQAAIRAGVEARRDRDLFDSAPIGILIASGRRIAMANPAALSVLGYSPTDLAGLSVLDIFPASLHGALASALDARVAGEVKEAAFSAPLRGKDGASSHAQVYLKGAILNDAPALAIYLVFAEETREIRKHISDRGEPSAAATPGEIGRRLDAMGRLAAGIAHDFNNLFTAINGYSDHLLTLTGAEGAMARGLKAIRKAGESAAAMTRGLAAFAHPGAGETRVQGVDAAVDALAPMLGSLLGEEVRLRIRAGAGPAGARLEPGRLEQILLSLAANAKEAMPGGGTLFLSTSVAEAADPEAFTHLSPRMPGPYVVLSLRDTGIGMDPEALDRLFEPYFTTHPRRRGSGYGLASIHGVVRQAGGGIAVESRPGRGSEFRVWLPRVEAPREEAAAAPEPAKEAAPEAKAPETPPGPGVGPAVLVVEDDPSLREMLRAVLERYGFRVETAAGSAEAEARLSGPGPAPDLMVTDVMLREGLGTEMAARLRDEHPSLRVLFISGHSVDTLADQGIRIAPEEFLEKPFTPSQLEAKVKAALAAPARLVR